MTVVAGPPKNFVSGYGWVVNGVQIFGGSLNQIGPVVAFPTVDLKSAALSSASAYLVFYAQDGAPIAIVDIKKLMQ